MLRKDHPAIAIAFGVVLLGLVIAAALAPNTGALPAQTSCPYGVCPSGQPTSFLWTGILIGLVAVAAILAVIVVLRRRRSRPPPGPAEPWSGAAPGAAAAAVPVAAPPPPPAGAPYLETPEDVGHPIPPVAPTAAPAAGEAAEPDIDSLMRELDKISGEILKRSGPKSGPESSTEGDANPPP